jgi:hypothetical protein
MIVEESSQNEHNESWWNISKWCCDGKKKNGRRVWNVAKFANREKYQCRWGGKKD